jgi:hypothetical protein
MGRSTQRAVEATVWKNDAENHDRYASTFTRLDKDDEVNEGKPPPDLPISAEIARRVAGLRDGPGRGCGRLAPARPDRATQPDPVSLKRDPVAPIGRVEPDRPDPGGQVIRKSRARSAGRGRLHP